MTASHGKEIKEPDHIFENITPHALCEFFEQHLPEKFDARTAGLYPITTRFLMANNTFVSFVFDLEGKNTKASLAEYNSGNHTGAMETLKTFYSMATATKALKDKEEAKKKKENEKKSQEMMARMKKERAEKNV